MSLQLKITDVDSRVVKGKLHNFYTIKTFQNIRQVSVVERRYSEFRGLNKKLTDARLALRGEGQKIPKLPHWNRINALFSNKISKDKLEKRRLALQKWLNLLVPNNVARSFNYFRDFIKLKRKRYADYANHYGGAMRYNAQTKKVTTILLDAQLMPSRTVSQASFNFSDNESVLTPKRYKAATSANKTEERVESPDPSMNTSILPHSQSMLNNTGSVIKLQEFKEIGEPQTEPKPKVKQEEEKEEEKVPQKYYSRMSGLEQNLSDNVNRNDPLLEDDSDYDLQGLDRSVILDSLYLNSGKRKDDRRDETLGIHESTPLNTNRYFNCEE